MAKVAGKFDQKQCLERMPNQLRQPSVAMKMNMYEKLRQFCLCEPMQMDYPEWPFPMLFHGHVISRDFTFLDCLIEYRKIKLGKNLVHDAGSFRYRRLNDWFHYKFFNGVAPIMESSETVNLLPRLLRLQRVLLDDSAKPQMVSFLKQELSVAEPQTMIALFISSIRQMIEICQKHDVVVWGMRVNETALQEHANYISEILAKIPFDLVFNLPHVKDSLYWTKCELREEENIFRKAELRYNKRLKPNQTQGLFNPVRRRRRGA